MKGFIYSSDPSGRASVTFWSLLMGGGGLFGAYNAFTSPDDWWIGLMFLTIGSLYIGLLLRTWAQFRDVFIDFAGVTIIQNNSERAFSWHDVTECLRVSWALPVPRSRGSLVQVYRLSFMGADTVAYFVPDRTGGRLMGNTEGMIQMIRREIAQAHGE